MDKNQTFELSKLTAEKKWEIKIWVVLKEICLFGSWVDGVVAHGLNVLFCFSLYSVLLCVKGLEEQPGDLSFGSGHYLYIFGLIT